MELLLASISIATFFFTIITFLHIFSSKPQTTKPPCPQSYPLIGNLPGFLRNRHRFHDWVADMLSDTPSSTLRVQTFLNLSRGLCTADPATIRHILSFNFQNYVKGTRSRYVLQDLIGDGIFNVDGHLWAVQRKIASFEFNTKSLKCFISDMVASEISDRLLPYLNRASDEDRIVDLQEVLAKFTFDNVCKLAFGFDPGCLRLEDDPVGETRDLSFAQAFDYAVETSSARIMSPIPILWKVKRFFNFGSEKRFREAVALIDQFAMEIINSRLKTEESDREKAQDLLSRFVSSTADLGFQDVNSKKKFLRDIVTSFVLAGRDTTSTTMTWFFWLISGHPRVTGEIQAELAASEAKTVSFSYDELKNMHYLHAAITESMRLFPPVPINSRTAVNDDVLPDGTHVGKGWFTDYSAYAVGRMERVWGPDCREFKPERWLKSSGGDEVAKFQACDQFQFPVFHCGPRICLGREMAYVQMKSIAAAVMRDYEIVAVDGGGSPERMMNPPYIMSFMLKMKGGLRVRLRRRRAET